MNDDQCRYIDSRASLQALVARIRHTEIIALDTEADSLHHYYEKVCLIQVSFDGDTAIVDPLSAVDLTTFLDILAGRRLLLHGADYDLRMLRLTYGFRPRREVFDTMLAAQILGYEQVGLSALTERFLNVTLPKHGQKSDWSIRPLSQQQVVYARDDTRYLELVSRHLLLELQRLGRVSWHQEACARMVESTAQDATRDPEHAWRIKQTSLLSRREQAFVREIWHWRESLAQTIDRPPFKIMANDRIIALAKWAVSHPDAPLQDGPPLPRHLTDHRLETLHNTIQKARAIPESLWPKPRKRNGAPPLTSTEKDQVDALRAACLKIAETLNIAPSILAPRAALEAVVRARPQTVEDITACSSLLKWQATLLTPEITRILSSAS